MNNERFISGFIACYFCGVEVAAAGQEKTENIASVSWETFYEERPWFPFRAFPSAINPIDNNRYR